MEQQSGRASSEELKEVIKLFEDSYEKAQIDIMFVRKSYTKPRTYKTYMLECSRESVKEMVKETLKHIAEALSERRMEAYDLELGGDETIQYVQKESVIHSEAILSSLTVQLNDTNTLNKNVDFNDLNFVVIQMYLPQEEKRLLLFKQHVKQPALMKMQAAVFSFNGKEFKPFTEKILTIGSNAEAFLVDDYYYILNRNKFNSMFDYKDAFVKIIDDNREMIVKTEMIADAEKFIELCKGDGRYMPRLTKAIMGKGFSNLVVNRSKLPAIKADYGLQIELEENKLVCSSKEDAAEILNLLLDHYVTSALTDNKMLAKAIEKYEIG